MERVRGKKVNKELSDDVLRWWVEVEMELVGWCVLGLILVLIMFLDLVFGMCS